MAWSLYNGNDWGQEGTPSQVYANADTGQKVMQSGDPESGTTFWRDMATGQPVDLNASDLSGIKQADNYANPSLFGPGGTVLPMLQDAAKKAGVSIDDWTPFAQKAIGQNPNGQAWMPGANDYHVYNQILNATGDPKLAAQAVATSDPRYAQGVTAGQTREENVSRNSQNNGANADLSSFFQGFVVPVVLASAGPMFSGAGAAGADAATAADDIGGAAFPIDAGTTAGQWGTGSGLVDAAQQLASATQTDVPVNDILPGEPGYQPAEIAQPGANAPVQSEAAAANAGPSATQNLAQQTVGSGISLDAATAAGDIGGASFPVDPSTTAGQWGTAAPKVGIIDRILNWADKHSVAASGALQIGSSAVSGLAKAALAPLAAQRQAQLDLQSKKDLAEFYRAFVRSGDAGGRGVNIGVRAPTTARPLMTPAGTPVYGPGGGIINRAMQG